MMTKGMIFLNLELCKKCGICTSPLIKICKKDVIKIGADRFPYIAQIENCVGCMSCEEHCPDFAITVRRSDLYEK